MYVPQDRQILGYDRRPAEMAFRWDRSQVSVYGLNPYRRQS